MMRPIRSLARDERGASVIELALVTPIFAAMLIGMVDLGRAYSYKLQLEQAAQRAIEKVQQYQASSSTYTTLQSEAATAAGVATSAVVVDYWLECNGTKQTNYNTTCAGSETYGRWVTVEVTGTFTPIFASRRWPNANANGTFTVKGKAGIRTQ
jgi:Flp pilus assembly protein TadG